MNTNESKRVDYNIVDGPSASALIDGLKYAYGNSLMTVSFSLRRGASSEQPVQHRARIAGIGHENGSGTSFIVDLYLMSDDKHYSGYYNASKKMGYLCKD